MGGYRINKLLLLEDHTAFRQTLALVFEREPEFEVCLQAGSLEDARLLLEDLDGTPDAGILDFGLTDGNGAELIPELREANPDFVALILTASMERQDYARAVEAGAAGVLHKSADVDQIISGVTRILNVETLFSANELIELLRLAGDTRDQELEDQKSIETLTPREMDVLQALAEGLSNREIAENLYMSLDTERKHMMNILSKLGVHSRLQAVLFAVRSGLVEID